MGASRVASVAGAIAVLTTAAALAADFPPPLPPPALVQLPVPADTTGWYLRGFVGVGQLHSQLQYIPNPLNAGIDFAIEHSALGDPIFIGGAIGYAWNNGLRLDGTGEYRSKATLHAWGSYTTFCPVGICVQVLDGFNKSWVVLANAYLDLGTWWRLTPFVGAGIGAAANSITGLSELGLLTGGRGVAPDHTTWNLAWAAHAGIAYDASSNLKFELAYRYLNLGPAWATPDCVGGCPPDIFRLKNVTSQDIMFGARWML